jgi:hypothetical protein
MAPNHEFKATSFDPALFLCLHCHKYSDEVDPKGECFEPDQLSPRVRASSVGGDPGNPRVAVAEAVERAAGAVCCAHRFNEQAVFHCDVGCCAQCDIARPHTPPRIRGDNERPPFKTVRIVALAWLEALTPEEEANPSEPVSIRALVETLGANAVACGFSVPFMITWPPGDLSSEIVRDRAHGLFYTLSQS